MRQLSFISILLGLFCIIRGGGAGLHAAEAFKAAGSFTKHVWAVAKADGKRLAEHELEGPPVFDGMATAGGRLYVCTMDGDVLCPGDRQ